MGLSDDAVGEEVEPQANLFCTVPGIVLFADIPEVFEREGSLGSELGEKRARQVEIIDDVGREVSDGLTVFVDRLVERKEFREGDSLEDNGTDVLAIQRLGEKC